MCKIMSDRPMQGSFSLKGKQSPLNSSTQTKTIPMATTHRVFTLSRTQHQGIYITQWPLLKPSQLSAQVLGSQRSKPLPKTNPEEVFGGQKQIQLEPRCELLSRPRLSAIKHLLLVSAAVLCNHTREPTLTKTPKAARGLTISLFLAPRCFCFLSFYCEFPPKEKSRDRPRPSENTKRQQKGKLKSEQTKEENAHKTKSQDKEHHSALEAK